MTTEIKENQRVARVIRVYGVEAPVKIILTREGLEAKTTGSGVRLVLQARWEEVIAKMRTPNKVPSWLVGEPIKMLNFCASRTAAAKIKKENKQ